MGYLRLIGFNRARRGGALLFRDFLYHQLRVLEAVEVGFIGSKRLFLKKSVDRGVGQVAGLGGKLSQHFFLLF